MISLNLRRVAIAATALTSLSTLSYAQKSFVLPHVLERDGQIVAIAWDLSGGQVEFVLETDASGATVVRRQHSAIGALYSLHGNDEIFKMVQAAFAGEPWDASYSIFRTDSRPVSGGSTSLSSGQQVTEVRFPACDVNSKEPAGIEVYFNPKEYKLERIPTPLELKAGATIAKKQKTWTPANFRVKLGNLPCSRITAVSNATGGTVSLPASRTATGFSLGDIAISIPLEDSPAFREVLRSTVEGKPIELPFRLDYLDDEGMLLMALEAIVYIVSVDKEDPLDPFDPSDAANKEKGVIVKVHEFRGHVTLIR